VKWAKINIQIFSDIQVETDELHKRQSSSH